MFLKVEQKLTGRGCQKSRYSTKFYARFVRRKKSLVKTFEIRKKQLSISCLLKESASILVQANRGYGGLKLGVFVTK